MALIDCPNCGQRVSDRARKCPHCGEPLVANTEKTVPAGNPASVPTTIQPRQMQRPPQPRPTPRPKPRRSNSAIWIAALCAAFLAGAAIVLLVTRTGRDTSAPAMAQTQAKGTTLDARSPAPKAADPPVAASTPSTSNCLMVGSHQAIDLGLPSGLLWATENLGATSPGDYGIYYDYGYVYYEDYASSQWGSGWRIPSEMEMNELDRYCHWTWTTRDGAHGMLVTGPNGNAIFLPAAGKAGKNSGAGVLGHYWTSSLCDSDSEKAMALGFDDHNRGLVANQGSHRFSIRPVCDP